MLEPLKHVINSKKIILASTSLRRKQILESVGLKFDTCAAECEENLDKSSFAKPFQYALATAALKSHDVANRMLKEMVPNFPDLIIGADTVVACNDTIFEKPVDNEDAVNMILRLSGKSHTVYTGVTMIEPIRVTEGINDTSSPFTIHTFYDATAVVLTDVTEETARAYVAVGESLDKAGGYAIQGVGGTLVEAIHGDYYNVMGFPLHKFCKELLAVCKKSWSPL